MNKHLIRIVTLLLVPCLVAEPGTASALHEGFSPFSSAHSSLWNISQALFQQEAVVPALQNDPLNPLEEASLKVQEEHTASLLRGAVSRHTPLLTSLALLFTVSVSQILLAQDPRDLSDWVDDKLPIFIPLVYNHSLLIVSSMILVGLMSLWFSSPVMRKTAFRKVLILLGSFTVLEVKLLSPSVNQLLPISHQHSGVGDALRIGLGAASLFTVFAMAKSPGEGGKGFLGLLKKISGIGSSHEMESIPSPEGPADEAAIQPTEPEISQPSESPEMKAQKRKRAKTYLSQIAGYRDAVKSALQRADLDKAQQQLELWISLRNEITTALGEGAIDPHKEFELLDVEFANLQSEFNTNRDNRQRMKDEAEAKVQARKDRKNAEKARREVAPVEAKRPVLEVAGPTEQEHPKEGPGAQTITSRVITVNTPIQRETKPVRLAAERNPYLQQLSALRDGQRAVNVEDLEKAEIYLPQVGDVPGSTQLLADVAALRQRKEAILKDARQALESGDIAKTTSLAAQTRGAVGYAQLIVDLEVKRQQQVAILATGREALQAKDYEKARAQALDLAAVNNPGGPKLLVDIEAAIAQEKERAVAQPQIDRINTLTQEIDKNLPMVRPPYPQVIRDLLLPNDRAVALLSHIGSATQDCRDFLITELESAAIAKRFEQGPDDEPQIPGEIRRILIKSQLAKFLPIPQPKYRREIENILQSGKRLGSSLLIIGKATQSYNFSKYPLPPDSSAEIVESFHSDKDDPALAADILRILWQVAFKAGESAYAEGRYGDAVEDFNNAAPYPGAAASLEQAQAAFATQKAAYEKGEQAFGESRYGEAIEAFQQAGSYPGAAERLAEAKVPFAAQEIDFKTGERAYQENRYREAEIAFRKAASYPGASERLADTKTAQRRSFEAGRVAHQENRLSDAVAELEKAGPYQGAKQRLEKVKATLAAQAVAFQAGRVAYRKGLYRDAVAAFQTAGTYPGAIEALEQAQAVFTTQKTAYEEGEQAFGDHRYGDAQAAFKRASSYPDAKQRLNKELITLVAQEAAYKMGEQANTEKRYADAVAAFKKAGSYPRAAEALELAQAALGIQAQFFKAGERAYRKSNYREAETAFRKAGSYPRAPERLADTRMAQRRSFEAGRAAHQENRLSDAVTELEKAGPYSGAKQRLEKAKATLTAQETAFKAGQIASREGRQGDAVVAFQSAGTYPGAAEALEQAQSVFAAQETFYKAGEIAYRRGLYGTAAIAFSKAGSYPGAADRLKQSRIEETTSKKAEKAERSSGKKRIKSEQNRTKVYPLTPKDIKWFETLFKKDSPTPAEAVTSYYQWVEWIVEQSETTLGELLARRTKNPFANQTPFPRLTPTLIEKIIVELQSQNATSEQIDGVISVLKLLSPDVSLADAFLKAGISAEMKSWVLKQLTLTLSNWVYPFIKQAGQDKVATDVVETNQEDPPVIPSDPASPKTEKRSWMGRERLLSADGFNTYKTAAVFSHEVGNNPLTAPLMGREDVRYNNRRTSRAKPRVVTSSPKATTPSEVSLQYETAIPSFSDRLRQKWPLLASVVVALVLIVWDLAPATNMHLYQSLFGRFDTRIIIALQHILKGLLPGLDNIYSVIVPSLLWPVLELSLAVLIKNIIARIIYRWGTTPWREFASSLFTGITIYLVARPVVDWIFMRVNEHGPQYAIGWAIAWTRNTLGIKAPDVEWALTFLLTTATLAIVYTVHRASRPQDGLSWDEKQKLATEKEHIRVEKERQRELKEAKEAADIRALGNQQSAEALERNRLDQAKREKKDADDAAQVKAGTLLLDTLAIHLAAARTARDHFDVDQAVQALDEAAKAVEPLLAFEQNASLKNSIIAARADLARERIAIRNAQTKRDERLAQAEQRREAHQWDEARAILVDLPGERAADLRNQIDAGERADEETLRTQRRARLQDVIPTLQTQRDAALQTRADSLSQAFRQAAAEEHAALEHTRAAQDRNDQAHEEEARTAGQERLVQVLATNLSSRETFEQQQAEVRTRQEAARQHIQADRLSRRIDAARERQNTVQNAVVENDDLAKRRAVQRVLRGIFLPKTAIGQDLVNWLYENGILTYSAANYAGIHTLRQLLVNKINETFPTLALSACGQMAAALLKGKRPFYILNRMKKDFAGVAYNSLSMEESWVIADLFKLPGIIDEAELLKAVGYSLTDSVHFERAEAAFSTGDFLEARAQLQKANDPADGRTQEMETAIQAHIQVVLQDPHRLLSEIRQWLPTTVRWPTGTDGIDLARWVYPQILTATDPQDMQARLSSTTTLPLFLARVPLHILFPSMSETSQLAIADQFMNGRRPYSLLDRMAVVTRDYPNIQLRVGPTHAIVTLFAQKNNVSDDKLPAALHDILSGQASAGARIFPIGKPRHRSLFGQLMGTFDINEVGSYGQSRQDIGAPLFRNDVRRYSNEYYPARLRRMNDRNLGTAA